MNMMKIFLLTFSITVVTSIGCGDSKKQDTVIETNNSTVNIGLKKDNTIVEETSKLLKVTFIEIGSINCIPCKMMQPIMRDIEREYPSQVRVVFHDVWTPAGKPEAMKYGIKAIPTQVFLDKDGKEYYRHIGFFPKEEVVKVLKMKGVN